MDTKQSTGTILLSGDSLSPEDLWRIGYDKNVRIDLTEEAWKRVTEGRAVIDRVLARGEVAYGINTGFGNFANVVIGPEDLKALQENLIRSHAAGVGRPLSPERTRMLLALRINVLAKGHSGIRVETLRQLLAALSANALSAIPEKGTVGASGDLAPLSHLALGLMGEGDMWDAKASRYRPAADVLSSLGLEPITLHAKEGLALINGTQLITALGCEAIVRSRRIARQCDVIAALTVEALRGSATPFHPDIHRVRPHRGQGQVAGRLRALLNFGGAPSRITHSHADCGRVQDSYTLRCIPQVHGISHDTIAFVYDVLRTEANSATDNPMVFADQHKDQSRKHHHTLEPDTLDDTAASSSSSPSPADGTASSCSSSSSSSSPSDLHGVILSGGNFHGEYPAKVLDYLAIAVHELASMSERRVERLVNPSLSALPAFLVPKGGLNSGFMIAHCTAAALVSENKTLCHPSSVDSLSTSAAQEDHVSMGGWAARKALEVVSNTEYCAAIELLCAVQAIDFLRPLTTTRPLEAVYKVVRSVVPKWDRDRHMSPDIEAVVKLLREDKIWDAVLPWIPEEYQQ